MTHKTKPQLELELKEAHAQIARLERDLEKKLREGEQRYNLLFRKLTVPAILVKLPELVIVDVNEACEKLTGFTQEEMLGKIIGELGLLSPEQRAQWISEFKEQGSVNDKETRSHTKSGEERVVLSNIHPVMIDGQPYAITTLQDITGRKRMEENLAESEARFATILENSPVAIGISRLSDGRITDVNAAFVNLYGFTREEIIGHSTAELDIWAIPEDRQQFIEQLRAGKSVRNMETVARLKSGSECHVLVSGKKVDISGKPYLLAQIQDISERKHAEKALQESQRNLQLFVEYSPAAIAMFDREMRYIAVSQRYIADYRISVSDVIGHFHYEIFPELPERWKEIHRRCLAGEIAMADADPFPRADGKLDWVQWEIHPWYEAGGTVGGIILSSEVITHRIELEQERAKLTERLDLASRSAHMGIWDWDIQKNELIWDEWMYALYGLRPGEFRGAYESWLNGVYPDDRELCDTAVLAAVRGEREYDIEFRVLWPDGSVHWLQANGQVFHDEVGTPLRMVGVNYEITEGKHAEEALRQSQNNFVRAFDSNPAALAVTSRLGGKFIIVNDSYTDVMGYAKSEIIGHTVAEFSIYVNPDERSELLRRLAEQGRVINYELTVQAKNKEHRYLLVSMEPITYDMEDCILSTFIDVTGRKRMEDELRRSNADLEQFAYIASHDLQEPLRAIAGMVQLLQKRYQGQLDGRADEYIAHAVEAAGRMQALIQALLTYSRVERRNQSITSVNAGTCVQAALKNLEASIRESHAVITTDELPTLHADAVQLTQLFQNLIGNAIKFCGEREPQVHISVTRSKENWEFSVRDNGIGIEPQYFERIFLIFQRLHTRREYSGTGIGLALCKKIVERHSGRIWVESEPGRGSIFHFTFPFRSQS